MDSPAKLVKDIPLPGLGTVQQVSGEYDSNELFFQFTTFTDPRSVWFVDMDTMQVEMLMQTKLSNMSPNMHDFITD